MPIFKNIAPLLGTYWRGKCGKFFTLFQFNRLAKYASEIAILAEGYEDDEKEAKVLQKMKDVVTFEQALARVS